MADKITNDDRNSHKQIISNELDPASGLQYDRYFLLKPELQKFNQETYDKMIDGTTDTFVFAEGQIPDTTPKPISEIGFVDKELFIDSAFTILTNMTVYGDGATELKVYHTGGESMRLHFKNEIFLKNHPLQHDQVQTETEIVYMGRLKKGTQLKLKPSDLSKPFSDQENFEPNTSDNRSYHAIKSFDEPKDTRLRDHLHDMQKLLFARWYSDYTHGGFAGPTWPQSDKDKLGNYKDKPFTAGILEVDGSGVVLKIHKVDGHWRNRGNSGKSPGIHDSGFDWNTAYKFYEITDHFLA